MQKLNLGVGLSMTVVRMIVLVILMSLAKAYAQQLPVQHAQLLQPPTPSVEQRLGGSIAALVVENARLAAELETARQTIEKLKEELARKNQSETK